MKFIVVIALLIASFAGGVYYENNRLSGEPDKTIAIMLSEQAIVNSTYQINENANYLNLVKSKKYKELEELIESNNQLLSNLRQDAASICDEVQCSEKQKSYVRGTKKNGS